MVVLMKGKLEDTVHGKVSALRGSGLESAKNKSKLRMNFKTYENGEEKLIGKWAYMDATDDGKSLVAIDKDGETLGCIRRTNAKDVQGDNYFLETGDMTIMAHKEEKGWSLYDVTDNGRSLVLIDKNSTRANNLRAVFLEARRAMNNPGARKQRTNCVGMVHTR